MLLESVVLWRRNIADKIWALQGYEKRLQNFRPITIHPIHGGNVAYLKTKKGAQFFGFLFHRRRASKKDETPSILVAFSRKIKSFPRCPCFS